MFTRVLIALVVLLGALFSAPAYLRGRGGAAASSCAGDPSASVDGCNGANWASNFIRPNFLAYAAMSGQTLAYYPCLSGQPVCWYLAGASDVAHGQGGYPVGYYTPKASLLDPTNQANLPTGCTYYPTGHAWYNGLGPMVDCASIASPTISGFDFGPTGSHGCVQLTFEGNVTGTITVTNSNFEADSTCAVAGALTPISPVFIGLIYFANTSKTNANITFDSFNGHWLDPCCNAIYNASLGGGKGLVPFYYFGNTGAQGLVTVDYSNMIGFNGAGLSVTNASPSAPPGGLIMSHSYQEGFEARAPYGHTDGIYFFDGTSTYPTVHFETYYNTVLQTGAGQTQGTGWQFHSTNATGYTTNVVSDHNFLVFGNLVTGASAYNVTAGGTIDDGAGGPGNIFTLTSGGPVYTGSSVVTGAFALADQIDATHWHVDCTINNIAPCDGGNKGKFASTSTSSSSVSVGPYTVTSQQWSNHWSNFPAVIHAHGSITNLTITNNYVDSFIDSGGGSPFYIVSPCVNPAVVTGNVDMRTGAPLPISGGGSGCALVPRSPSGKPSPLPRGPKAGGRPTLKEGFPRQTQFD